MQFGIKWVGPLTGMSGYAKATRDYIKALTRYEHPILTVKDVRFASTTVEIDNELRKWEGREIDYDVVVYHMPPVNIHRFYEPDKHSVSICAWEVEPIAQEQVDALNKYADHVIVPSGWNQSIFRKQIGCRVDCVPHCIDFNIDRTKLPYQHIYDVPDDAFKFYSIFQWNERKAPESLLKAYLTTFTEKDNVALILKTFIDGTGSQEEINEIASRVQDIMVKLHLPSYPKVKLVVGELSDNEIDSIHDMCDCFVLPTRAEGFGIPFVEAKKFDNLVIGTKFNGFRAVLDPRVDDLVDGTRTPCFGMDLYPGSSYWLEPDIRQLSVHMLGAYIDRRKVKKVERDNRKWSYKVVSKQLMEAIRVVYYGKVKEESIDLADMQPTVQTVPRYWGDP